MLLKAMSIQSTHIISKIYYKEKNSPKNGWISQLTYFVPLLVVGIYLLNQTVIQTDLKFSSQLLC